LATDTAAPPTAPLLLIDGNSLAYRAFHALPDTIATADGFPTNALYGLAAMMMKMLAEERPGRVVVAWDPRGKTFRHREDPTYKANRSTTPDLLREQQPHFRPLMEAFGFVNTEVDDFEADDVLGTLAKRAEEAGQHVVILTGDRDAFQLVSDRISVMATGRGVTDTTLYTPDAVRERYGIGPELMPDFRGMVGDTSDNLPGVPSRRAGSPSSAPTPPSSWSWRTSRRSSSRRSGWSTCAPRSSASSSAACCAAWRR
jgi:DNA polymerase-1